MSHCLKFSSYMLDKNGQTPLMVAEKYRHPEVVRTLKDAQACMKGDSSGVNKNVVKESMNE